MHNIIGNFSVCASKIGGTANIILIHKSFLALAVLYLHTVEIA